MGLLIPLEPGLIVNTDKITSIQETYSEGGRERLEVTFTDGRRRTVPRRLEDIEYFVGPIIPAPPGYQVIRAFPAENDGEETAFDTVPVLAFRLTEAEPIPVTPLSRLGDHWALIWPDGRADEPWNRIWPGVEAYKASFGSRGVRNCGEAP